MNPPAGLILVVEDIPNVRELLEVTLRFKGYRVVTAADGQEALEQIVRERPALVITDLLMPRVDGFTLAFRLRRKADTRQIPIIFISATYITPEDKTFALSLGGVCFIEKPIDTEIFLRTIADALSEGAGERLSAMDEETFYIGYMSRLDNKLRHKNTQITRTQRLLVSLPENQKETYEELLLRALRERDEVQAEIDALNKLREKKENLR
jgi:DNA-binding response OmpR family regulator